LVLGTWFLREKTQRPKDRKEENREKTKMGKNGKDFSRPLPSFTRAAENRRESAACSNSAPEAEASKSSGLAFAAFSSCAPC
jgi:hypothetical protein